MENTLSTCILVGYLWRFLDELFADEEGRSVRLQKSVLCLIFTS
jgi:hypothetical protein